MSDQRSVTPFIVGWEEWLALPDLGLPAIRAKIDTGAKTSALHAFEIETFGPAQAPMARFGVHPVPGREDIYRYCTAAIVDRRDVTSSNGDRESRYVIRTKLVLGDRDWGEIETTLANRESMAYRMLLGRQAIRGGMLVDPSASFLQSRLSHRLYAALPPQERPRRRLRIVIIATRPERRSNILLREEGERRGHDVRIIALDDVSIGFEDERSMAMAAQAPLAADAVILRVTGGPPGLASAVSRLLQRDGTVTLLGADTIEQVKNQFAVAEKLGSSGLVYAPLTNNEDAAVLVVAGTATATRGKVSAATRATAVRAANALGLGFAAVSLNRDGAVASFDLNPSLTAFKPRDGIAAEVISALESRTRSPHAVPIADSET